jgi:hypothetical protein
MYADFEDLKGKTLFKIEENKNNDEILFYCTCGDVYKMCHVQDCCESVYLEDVCGDWDDLIGSEILLAEDVWSKELEEQYDLEIEFPSESHTWTFYKIATIKGYVTLRWYGESNGYYSESVDFLKMNENGSFNNY